MPHHRPIRAGLLLTAATAAALCSEPAAAQEAPAEGFFQMLGRIILGTGTAKVAIDTPQAVTALEQEDLDQRQATTLAEAIKGIPGVSIAGSASRVLGQAFNIRGIGKTEDTAAEDRIKVIVDGAPKGFEQYRMGTFFGDLDLFKRVEILRGPASGTLYGSGAIGGVVLFETKDASDFLAEGETTALKFKGSYASNGDLGGLGATYATRIGNAEFLASFNGSQSGDMEDGAGNPIVVGDQEVLSALLKGKWYFGNDNDQSFTLSFARSETTVDDGPASPSGAGPTFLASFGLMDSATTDDTFIARYNHGFAGNDLLDLSVQLSYTNTEVEKNNFSFGFLCMPGTLSVLCDSSWGYETVALKVENVADLSTGAWENYLTFGVQVSEQERSATTTAGSPAFHPEGTDRKIGVYAQGEFTWNEKLVLIPGIRVDFGDRTPSAATVAIGGEAVEDTAVSPKLAVLYKFNDSFSVFGSYAQTERLPTLDELYATGGVQSPSLNLSKEKARNIELGLAYQTQGVFNADDTLALKVTGFHNDMTDLIARNTGGAAGTPYYVNIAAAKIWGAELEAAYDAERWFASLAWSKVKSRNETPGASFGTQLADTPAENVALTVGAKLPERDLVIGWRAYYFDAIDTGPAFTAPDYAHLAGKAHDVHDIFVTWKPDEGAMAGLEVSLVVENVFDKEYMSNLALDPSPGLNAKLSISKGFTW